MWQAIQKKMLVIMQKPYSRFQIKDVPDAKDKLKLEVAQLHQQFNSSLKIQLQLEILEKHNMQRMSKINQHFQLQMISLWA